MAARSCGEHLRRPFQQSGQFSFRGSKSFLPCRSGSERGEVRYTLKSRYRDGTTHMMFDPLDFLARLASLVPRPRVNLTRFHGVLAPNAKWRGAVTPSGRGRGGRREPQKAQDPPESCDPAKRQAMNRAQRLKRVFRIEIERCGRCGGAVRVLAAIEDSAVIERILAHVGELDTGEAQPVVAGPRGPPG